MFGSSVFLAFFTFIGGSFSFTLQDTDNLYADLMKGYNKATRGTKNQTEPTWVYAQFNAISIIDFDDVKGILSIVGYFDMAWKDERMVWDPETYNGVSSIIIPQDNVWKPVIILSNGNGDDGQVPLGKDWMTVRYLPDGTANWYPTDLFNSHCPPNIEEYPYDVQKCSLHFVPTGYSSYELRYYIPDQQVRLSLYVPNGVWDLTNATINSIFLPNSVEVMLVDLTISRRATYFVVNMILPIGLLGALNLLVFILPAESGERVGYSITLLLAICVFLTIASDNLPKTSYPSTSILCIKLLVDILISSFVMFFTILGLRIYHKDDKNKVPGCIASWTRCILCRCCRRKNESSNVNYDTTEEHQLNGVHTIYDGKLPRTFYYEMPKKTGENDRDDVMQDITWSDVGQASDIVFFVITLLAFAASHITYVIYINK